MEKEVDINRWSDLKNFNPAWGFRSELAAKYIAENDIVLDIGCGSMHLETCLPCSCKYLPSDIVARDDRTIVFDFNKDALPAIFKVNVVTLLGVVEYMLDPKGFLSSLKKYKAKVILSYTVREYSERDLRWFNCYSKQQLFLLIQEAGFTIAVKEQIDAAQWLFVLNINEG